MFSSKESTKDVISRYQGSLQMLVDAMHQVQKDIKCLKDTCDNNFSNQHEESQYMSDTLRELRQASIAAVQVFPTPAALRLDLQQGFDEVLDSIHILMKGQLHLLQQSQAPARRVRPIGLIEGMFRGFDLLLMKGFMRAANRHCVA